MAIDFTKSYPVIEWDLNGPHFYTKYFGKKDENARGFKVQILQDGEVLIPTTETLRIYCKKKDGTKVYIDSLSKIDTYFIINLTNQVFAIAGIVECELELSSNSKRIYSPTFGINVSDNLVDGSIVSSDDFIALQNALNKVDNLEETYAPRLTAVETGKIDKSAIVNNTVTTTPETVLDGRVGKTLQDQITTINDNLAVIIPVTFIPGVTGFCVKNNIIKIARLYVSISSAVANNSIICTLPQEVCSAANVTVNTLAYQEGIIGRVNIAVAGDIVFASALEHNLTINHVSVYIEWPTVS